jgi:hypothetical protein
MVLMPRRNALSAPGQKSLAFCWLHRFHWPMRGAAAKQLLAAAGNFVVAMANF